MENKVLLQESCASCWFIYILYYDARYIQRQTQIPYFKVVNISSSIQEISHILSNLKLHYSFYKGLPFIPVHVLPFCLFKIHPSICQHMPPFIQRYFCLLASRPVHNPISPSHASCLIPSFTWSPYK